MRNVSSIWRTRENWVNYHSPVLYLPLWRMSVGTSENLITWTGSAPSGDWTGVRAILSDVTTPTPPVSAKAIKMLCDDAGGAGQAYGYQDIAKWAKLLGITATYTAQGQAESGNTYASDILIYDGVAAPSSSDLAKDDAWHPLSMTMLIASNGTILRPYLRVKTTADADADDVAYFDDPVLTIPQSREPSNGILVHPEGCYRVKNGFLFDGTDDLITCETDPIADNACTIVATIKPTGWGEGGFGAILDNGKLIFDMGDAQFFFTSDGTTTAFAAASGITLGQTYRIGVTRSADGASTNFYVNGALSGAANQNSGTPAAGDTLLCVGNNLAGSGSFAGTISEIAAYTKIWTAAEVARDAYNWKRFVL